MNNIKDVLASNKIIAVIGLSDNPSRPSNRVARYLYGNGYKVYGVNPKLAGKCVNEIKCFASLKDLPENVHIVNVFRRSEFLLELMKDITELNYKPSVVWTQIGVIDSEANKLAGEKGIVYIESKCIMTEHQKLL